MEDICLENLWRSDLEDKGWSTESAQRLQFCLAKGTLRSYNVVLSRYSQFCQNHGYTFPPVSTAVLAEFLREVADKSDRPNSVLHTTIAALGHLYTVKGICNVVDSPEIRLLITGLVKSGTIAPMVRSKVMPVQKFNGLFSSWPENVYLEVKNLRLKAICLLALALMLRPSDIAPKALHSENNHVEQICFSVKQVEIQTDSAKFTFFGIKNDTSRSGFEVMIPRAKDAKLDPIGALECYIEKTSSHRAPDGPVFLSLKAPYTPLQASSVAKILEESIKLAGLEGMGYSAKSFRPTGATSAIEQKVNPDIVRKIGRWKNSEVFYAHYVHAQTPSEYTDELLSHARKF